MRNSTIILGIIFLFGFTPVSTEAQFQQPMIHTKLVDGKVHLIFTGQYRVRFTAHTGKDFLPGGHVEEVSQRVRLGFGLDYANRIQFYVQAQDVRTWGEESDTLGDFTADGFDLHQAWVQLRIVDRFFMRVGRQELNIDGQRLIGAVDWSMQARSFDGIQFYYWKKPFHARLFYAKLGEKNTRNNAFERDRDLGVAYFKYSVLEAFQPSVLYVVDTDYKAKRVRHTVGAFFTGAISGFKYTLEGYVQLGEVGGSDIFAFMGALRVGYTFKKAAGFGIEAWFDYLSGDDDPTSGKVKAFDTLFATNHKFYGYMDFFLNVPLHTKNRGLMDAGARLKVAPKKVLIFVDYHFFRTARKFSTGEANIGHEIDLVVAYKFFKYFKVDVTYGLFLPGTAMKQIKGSDSKLDHLVYLTADFAF